jgi:hypothetical protein
MRVEPVVECPHGHREVKLTESPPGPIVASTRRHYEDLMRQRDADAAARVAGLDAREREIQAAEAKVGDRVTARLREDRARISAEDAVKARNSINAGLEARARVIAGLEGAVKAKDDTLAAGQRAQAELIRLERELAGARRDMELTIEQRIPASAGPDGKDASSSRGGREYERFAERVGGNPCAWW